MLKKNTIVLSVYVPNEKHVFCTATYPEIGDSSFRCALWTFKQQLTWKVQARCGISIVLL